MRASRAYIAGVGTTGVLVASAILLLAVVSALVAFQGWPGSGFGEDIESLVVDEPKRLAVEGPSQVALNAASAAAAVANSPRPGTAAAGGPVRVSADFGSTPVAEGTPGPAAPDAGFRSDPTSDREIGLAPGPEQPDPGPGGLLPETPLSPQVNRITESLGTTTQGLTDGLGNTVGQLNPQLGQTLTDSGRVLAELLRGLGRPRR